MSKPLREFWIHQVDGVKYAVSHNDTPFRNLSIHVREVREIDWAKVWTEIQDDFGSNVIYDDQRAALIKAIEKQIKGEE